MTGGYDMADSINEVFNKVIYTKADIQAGLEEQKVRDKLIELGWTPPLGPAAAINEQMLEALKRVSQSTGFWYLDFDDRQDVSNAIAAAESAKEV